MGSRDFGWHCFQLICTRTVHVEQGGQISHGQQNLGFQGKQILYKMLTVSVYMEVQNRSKTIKTHAT